MDATISRNAKDLRHLANLLYFTQERNHMWEEKPVVKQRN